MPADLRVRLDPTVRRDGGVLLGGEPYGVLQLSARHQALLDRWQDGEPVGGVPHEAALARALISMSVLVPQPEAGAGPGVDDVTVVVPVRDRPQALRRLLAALRADPSGATRVVVVDDASCDPDAHARLAREAGTELVRRQVRGGPAAARDDGLRRVRTPVVAFVDSDCSPAPHWLLPLLAHLGDPLVAAAAPRVVGSPESRGGWLGTYQAERSAMDRGDLPGLVHPGGRVPFVPTAALVVRRSTVLDGFDEDMDGGEDVDLVWRLAAAGWHVRYAPESVVGHDHPQRAAEWAGKRFSYGRSAADIALRHPGSGAPLSVSPWTAAAWGAVAVLPPGAGALAWTAVTSTATALLARELRTVLPRPTREAVLLAGGGTLLAGRDVADALARMWWPGLAVAGAVLPSRRPLLLLGAAAAWSAVSAHRASRRSREHPAPALPWVAVKVADDLAYGAGVWWGSVRRRTAGAVLPRLGWRLRVLSSEDLAGEPQAPAGPGATSPSPDAPA